MKRKFIIALIVSLVILTNCILVYATESEFEDVEAKVVKAGDANNVEQETGITKIIQETEVRILEGEYENEEYEMNYIISEDINSITSKVELKEDDMILVSIEQKDGEILNVKYKEVINRNYMLYIVLLVLIVLVLVIGKKYVIKPLIVYIVSIMLICFICMLAIQNMWNLILISSIISIIITVSVSVKVNGITKKTIAMILCSVVGCAIAGILMYILYDIMMPNNVEIKMGKGIVNLKEMLCAISILFGGIFANIITLSSFNMFSFLNKPYKTKSDNIIDGKRSLKI